MVRNKKSSTICESFIFFETKQSASGFIRTVPQFYEHLESQESLEFTKMSTLVMDDDEYKFAFRRVFYQKGTCCGFGVVQIENSHK